MSADYAVHGDVAVISMNNPPVNGLGFATRQAIVQGLQKALDDDAVKAVVITGARYPASAPVAGRRRARRPPPCALNLPRTGGTATRTRRRRNLQRRRSGQGRYPRA